MNKVDAVQTREEINLIEEMLREYHGDIYGDIWRVGVNVTMSVSDLLSLTYENFVTKNKKVQQIIHQRAAEHPYDRYIFQVHSNRTKTAIKPISRTSVSRAIKDISDRLGLNINANSMKKTRKWIMSLDGIIPTRKTNRKINPDVLKDLQDINIGDVFIYNDLTSISYNLESIRAIINIIVRAGGIVKFKSGMTFDSEDKLTILNNLADFQQQSRKYAQREGIQRAKKAGKYKGKQSRFKGAILQEIKDKFNKDGVNKSELAREYGITRQHLYRLVEFVD